MAIYPEDLTEAEKDILRELKGRELNLSQLTIALGMTERAAKLKHTLEVLRWRGLIHAKDPYKDLFALTGPGQRLS